MSKKSITHFFQNMYILELFTEDRLTKKENPVGMEDLPNSGLALKAMVWEFTMDILAKVSELMTKELHTICTINLVIFVVKLFLGDMLLHGVKKGLRIETVNTNDKMSDY